MINFKGFIDTTFRDGQASPVLFDSYKYYFSLAEKKQLIEALLDLGVRHFEFFSPIVSQTEKKHFCAIKKHIRSLGISDALLLAHCRCHKEDVDQAIKAGFDGLNLYIGLSKNAQEIYGKNLDELLKLAIDTLKRVRNKHPHIWLRFSGEDAFRTKLSDLFTVYDQVVNFVDTIGTPDTTGTATPETVSKRIKALKKRYPRVNLECHFHNDRGLATANTLAAVQNGAEYIDSSVWGIAERSGITSITSALLNLFYLDPNIVKNYKLEASYPLNVLMASILKQQVPWQEPVSLTNRTHIAGVHQKGVLTGHGYEAHHLEKFGVSKHQLLLGPLSGWNFIYYYLKEIENYILTEEQAKEISTEFRKTLNKKNRKIKPEKVLHQIASKHSLVRIEISSKYARKRTEKLDG
jgi:homocitrate synthase